MGAQPRYTKAPITEALIELQGRRYSPEWRLDDASFMIVRWLGRDRSNDLCGSGILPLH